MTTTATTIDEAIRAAAIAKGYSDASVVTQKVQDRPGALPLVVTEGHVRFDDVWFAYDPVRPILRGVSFDVPPGRTVAIVGPSGLNRRMEAICSAITLIRQPGADPPRRTPRSRAAVWPAEAERASHVRATA